MGGKYMKKKLIWIGSIIIVMLLSLFVDINAFIQPEGVKCYFNETMKIVLELDFIKNLLSGVIV